MGKAGLRCKGKDDGTIVIEFLDDGKPVASLTLPAEMASSVAAAALMAARAATEKTAVPASKQVGHSLKGVPRISLSGFGLTADSPPALILHAGAARLAVELQGTSPTELAHALLALSAKGKKQ